MRLAIGLLALLVGTSGQTPSAPTLDMLRARAQERMRQDLAVYSAQDFKDLEALYQSANKDLSSPDAKGILQRVVTQYPKSNRAGSALLYLAQLTSGDEREKYLKTAIESYTDTWYGDGVQVGAFARAQLAMFYSVVGRTAEARTLAREVAAQFPGAVDHRGQPLADILRKQKLLE